MSRASRDPAKKGQDRYTLTEPKTGETHTIDADHEAALTLQLARDRTGGLYVIGTERHESRRIDRQLRGRCSRQGDPGLTQVLPLARGRPACASSSRATSPRA